MKKLFTRLFVLSSVLFCALTCGAKTQAFMDNPQLAQRFEDHVKNTQNRQAIDMFMSDEDYTDVTGLRETAFFVACKYNNTEVAKFMLENCPDHLKFLMLETPCVEGKFPIYIAVCSGNKDLVELLIAHRANTNISNNDDYKEVPLHAAICMGRSDIADILIRCGAHVNIQNKFGNTPLHVAAMEGRNDMVEFLINRKAVINIQNNSEITPLHVAAMEGRNDIAKILIKCGANINAKDNHGNTPLHVAALSRNFEIMIFLINCGADPSIKNKSDSKPLYIEELSNYHNTVSRCIK